MTPGESEQRKAAKAAWSQRNKDKLAAARVAWRQQNKDKVAAYQAAWRQQNREAIAASNAAYKKRNREQITAQRRIYEPQRQQRAKAEAAKKRAAVERVTAYAAANPAESARRKREWAANNPEKVKKAQREYLERNRAAVQQRADMWRTANTDRIANYPSNRPKDPRAAAESNRQRRADPATYAHDLQRNRDRRRLIRRLKAQGLPPPLLQKATASERRLNGAAAREFFTRTRTRTAIERRTLIRNDDGPPTPKELQTAARERTELRRQSEIRERTHQYIARHGQRIRDEIELDSHARQLRGATPLDIGDELAKRVRTFTDSYSRPLRPTQPSQDRRHIATAAKSPTIPHRQNNTGLGR